MEIGIDSFAVSPQKNAKRDPKADALSIAELL